MRIRSLAVVCAAGAALAVPAGAAARTKVVYAGGPAKWSKRLATKTGAEVDGFLVNRVTINAGASVVWNGKSLANGFHTVDIPALGQSDLPLYLPTGQTVSGVNDVAGAPFWFSIAHVPDLGYNPALFLQSAGGTYDGTQRLESGLPLGAPKDFKVTFTKPGVYKYFCDVHAGMVGYVIVRKKGEAVPSRRADAAALAAQEATDKAQARRIDRTKVRGNKVSLGVTGKHGVEVLAMFPARLKVKQGATVTFFMSKRSRETHTATFGPDPYLGLLAKGLTAYPLDPRSVYSSDPAGHIVLTPASHGNGFASTGTLDRDKATALAPSGAITFAHPGVYHFVCLIHPFMKGTIVVK